MCHLLIIICTVLMSTDKARAEVDCDLLTGWNYNDIHRVFCPHILLKVGLHDLVQHFVLVS